jgi:hypothetical protein
MNTNSDTDIDTYTDRDRDKDTDMDTWTTAGTGPLTTKFSKVINFKHQRQLKF